LAIVVAGAKAEMVKGPSDLKGMRIGVSAPGSLSNVVASLYLSQGGLKPSDVSFVGVGTGASALAALRSGQIDVLSSVDPAITILESRGEIKILADTRTRKGSIALLGGLPASASLYTTEPFLRQHPKSVQALANAIVRADRWLVHAPATEVFATLSESYPLGDRSIYLAAFEKLRETYSADGLFTEAGVKSALEFVLAADKDIDPTRIRLADTYTNEFVLRAPSGMP
jgi:NitT/TauT family transport system substrate-binding protein